MIHAHTRWPDENSPDLWPFAMSYAAWLHNHIPSADNHLAPLEIFTSTKMNCEYLRRAKVFGCPSYMLDPRLQDGHKLPKWEIRARLAQFLGFDPKYSSTVGIIRNISTGYCSTQFHVVYDQLFTTVASSRPLIDLTKTWIDLLQSSRENLSPEIDGTLPPFDPVWLPPDECPAPPTRLGQKRHCRTPSTDDSSSSSSSSSTSIDNDAGLDDVDVNGQDDSAHTDHHGQQDELHTDSFPHPATPPDYHNQGEPDSLSQGERAPPPNNNPTTHPKQRRSTRQSRPAVHFKDYLPHDAIDFEDTKHSTLFSIPRTINMPTPDRWIDWQSQPRLTNDHTMNTFNAMLDNMTCPLTGEIHYQHPGCTPPSFARKRNLSPPIVRFVQCPKDLPKLAGLNLWRLKLIPSPQTTSLQACPQRPNQDNHPPHVAIHY
jgi:hypothetical protein